MVLASIDIGISVSHLQKYIFSPFTPSFVSVKVVYHNLLVVEIYVDHVPEVFFCLFVCLFFQVGKGVGGEIRVFCLL